MGKSARLTKTLPVTCLVVISDALDRITLQEQIVENMRNKHVHDATA
jgi:hypothetical protein